MTHRCDPVRAALAGAALLLAAVVSAPPAHAQGFPVRTAGDLAALCAGGPGGAQKAAAINFCHGYAQGVLSLLQEHASKSVCLPAKPPSRTQTMASFIAWTKSSENRASAPAARGLEAFFKETFACK